MSGSAQAQNLCAQVGFSIDDRTSNCGPTGPVSIGPLTRVNPNRTTSTQKAEGEATADYGQLHVGSSVVDDGLAGGRAGWADSFTITGPTPGTVAPFVVTFRVTADLSVPDTRDGADSRFAGGQITQLAAWLFGLPAPSDHQCVGLHLRNGPENDCSYSVTELKQRIYNFFAQPFPQYTDNIANSLERTFTVQLEVGRTYSVSQEVMAQTTIAGMFWSMASADVSAFLYVDPISPEYGYTTGTGKDYRSPVTNTAPTASAGNNQTVRPATTVHLDGSGSFDDNTPTIELQYSWLFVSVPSGSQATLTGADTATPTFLPDAHGSSSSSWS